MDQEPTPQPPAATDVSVDSPPHPESETKTKDSTSSQDQQVAADVQTGQGDSFPEKTEEGDDIIVEYHRKGKGSKPIAGGPPKR